MLEPSTIRVEGPSSVDTPNAQSRHTIRAEQEAREAVDHQNTETAHHITIFVPMNPMHSGGRLQHFCNTLPFSRPMASVGAPGRAT